MDSAHSGKRRQGTKAISNAREPPQPDSGQDWTRANARKPNFIFLAFLPPASIQISIEILKTF